MNFETEIEKMNFKKLVTEFNGKPEDFLVVEIAFECLKSILDVNIDKRFPTEELYIDQRMQNLIDYAYLGSKIIPPELRFLPDGRCIVFDGQHRFGLARRLKLERIPFLVKRHDVKLVERLDSDCFKYL